MADMVRPLVFTTTADLVAWMQDDGINDVVLHKLVPEPNGDVVVPDVVSFSWRVYDPGLVRPHKVVASGVTAWSLSSTRDQKTAIGFSMGNGDGVSLVMHVPGPLVLQCRSLAVTVGRVQKPRRRPHAASDYKSFVIIRPGTVPMAAVLSGLAAPSSAQVIYEGKVLDAAALAVPFVRHQHTSVHIQVDGTLWVELLFMPPIMPGECRITVIRRTINDGDWRHAVELARHIGPCRVEASWDFDGSDVDWVAEIAAGEAQNVSTEMDG
jgi:hypothetical protein